MNSFANQAIARIETLIEVSESRELKAFGRTMIRYIKAGEEAEKPSAGFQAPEKALAQRAKQHES